MIISDILRSGDEVRVNIGDECYVAKVCEITGVASFTILMQWEFVSQTSGERYSVSCVTERGLWMFKVHATILYDTPQSIELKVISEYVKLQRRSTFRVRETLPVKVLEMTNDISPELVDATTADISESGVLLRYNSWCAIGQLVKLIIRIDRLGMDVLLPPVAGRVVRCEKSKSKGFDYVLAIEFEGLPERSRNEIIRFVVLSQRRRMKDFHTKRYRSDR